MCADMYPCKSTKVQEDWQLTVRYVNVARLVHKSEDEASVRWRRWSLHATTTQPPDLWRLRHSVSETHIYVCRVSVINHDATPRTSCFLWHMLFDKFKLTDTAERFITFSPFVCCTLNNLHAILLWRYLLDSHTRPLHQDKCVIVH